MSAFAHTHHHHTTLGSEDGLNRLDEILVDARQQCDDRLGLDFKRGPSHGLDLHGLFVRRRFHRSIIIACSHDGMGVALT
jgi:hypothetical protein